MELREKIAREVFDARGSTEWTPEIGDKCAAAADRILAIPEIAAGQELLRAHGDMLAGGTSYVRVERVDPATVKNDGHRISTAEPD
jgi:hypothetical protein